MDRVYRTVYGRLRRRWSKRGSSRCSVPALTSVFTCAQRVPDCDRVRERMTCNLGSCHEEDVRLKVRRGCKTGQGFNLGRAHARWSSLLHFRQRVTAMPEHRCLAHKHMRSAAAKHGKWRVRVTACRAAGQVHLPNQQQGSRCLMHGVTAKCVCRSTGACKHGRKITA